MTKNEFIQNVEEIQNNSETCIVTSIDSEGYPCTRAMLTMDKKKTTTTMYFSTNTSSKKIQHFTTNNHASVYYVDYHTFTGITLVGTMEIIQDMSTKEYFFEDGDEVYYPLGPTDPDYSIIKFTARKGYYYHNLQTVEFTL